MTPAGEIPKTALPEPRFTRGPELTPWPALLRWLAWQRTDGGAPRLVRLPVLVTLHLRSIVDARLGVAGEPGALALDLDDSALGVSLLDRALQHAAGSERCALWLEGYWASEPRLRVVTLRRPIPAAERALATFAAVAYETEELRALAARVDALADSGSTDAQHQAARDLVESGHAALPVLIGSLGDARAFARRDTANRHNLPAFAAPPAPRISTITVGERCSDLLYEIITPHPASPHAGRFKVFSEQVLRVPDWYAWWADHRARSLEDIHRALEPLVDAYWQQHGTTQTVPRGGRAAP